MALDDAFSSMIGGLTDPSKPGPAGPANTGPAPATTPAIDPYKMPEVIGKNISDVQAASTNVADMFDKVSTGLGQIAQTREQTSAAADQTRQQLLKDGTAATQSIVAQAAPIFAARTAIDARRVELQQMNPLKRALFGVFNRNFDPNHLNNLESAYDTQLQDAAQQYQLTSQSLDKQVDLVNQGEASTQDMLQGKEGVLNNDLNTATTKLQLVRGQLADSIQGMQGTSESIMLQQHLLDQAMTTVGSDNINQLLGQARKDGYAVVNGAKIPLAQLQDRNRQLQVQALDQERAALGVQSAKLGIASQSLALNEAQERHLVFDGMTQQERINAAQNGNVFNGRRLNPSILAEAMEGDARENAQLAQHASMGSVPGQFTGLVDQWDKATDVIAARAREAFGGNGAPVIAQHLMTVTNRLHAMQQSLAAAKTPDAKAALMTGYMREASGWMDQANNAVKATVGRFSRDPAVQNMMMGYLTGQQVAPTDMIHGVIGMVKSGSFPPNFKFGAIDGRSLAAAKAAIQQTEGDPNFQKLKAADKDNLLVQRVGTAMNNVYTQSISHQVISSIPGFAKQIGHPAGRISPQDLATASAAGDANGYNAFASALGMTTAQAHQIFTPGGQQIYQRIAVDPKTGQTKPGMDMDSLRGRLAQYQMQSMLTALDSGRAAAPGFVPSRALADLLNDSRTNQAVANHFNSLGQKGLGMWMADGINGGGLHQNYANYAQAVISGVQQNEVARTQQQVQNLQAYGADPMKRAETVLAGTTLSQHDQQLLLQAIHPAAQGSTDDYSTSATDRIDAAIMTHKFADPHLERIRKEAAKQWQDVGAKTDSQMQAIMNRTGIYSIGKL